MPLLRQLSKATQFDNVSIIKPDITTLFISLQYVVKLFTLYYNSACKNKNIQVINCRIHITLERCGSDDIWMFYLKSPSGLQLFISLCPIDYLHRLKCHFTHHSHIAMQTLFLSKSSCGETCC